MNSLKKVIVTIVLATVLQACIKKPAHSVRFNEFVHSGQGTYLLSNYQPVDTAEYFLLFSGDLSETDFEGDLMIVFDNDSKELQQTIPKSKMFQCNWSNLEKKYSSGTNNMALKIKLPVNFRDSNDPKSVDNMRRPGKSDHAVAKLSYGGETRRIDRRSWMLDQAWIGEGLEFGLPERKAQHATERSGVECGA